jgi:hypothetical protein
MAGVAYVYKRLWNAEVVIDANEVLPFNGYRHPIHGRTNPHYQIRWHGTTQADEELGTAPTSDKDGQTTPFQVTVVSSDVGDKRTTAAGYVHSVCLVGNSVKSIENYIAGLETPKTTLEVVAMNGTTDVLSVRYYTNLWGLFACEWGTGATHDAEGNITAESPANTTLLTIAATFNESEGCTLHFLDGDEVTTHHVRISPTAALAAGDGASVVNTWSGFDHTLNDATIPYITDTYTYIHYGGEYRSHQALDDFPRQSTLTGKVVVSEKLIANAKALEIEVVFETQAKKMYPININPS